MWRQPLFLVSSYIHIGKKIGFVKFVSENKVCLDIIIV